MLQTRPVPPTTGAVLAVLAASAFSACAPGLVHRPPPAPAVNARESVRRSGRAGLINPLLDVLPTSEFAELRPFEARVRQAIERRQAAGKAAQVAVFWQDLDNGQLFNINANLPFSPASLLKVPLLIAALKQAQSDPGLLARKVPYTTAALGVEQAIIGQGAALKPGQEYPVDELLRAMIARSDNGAALTVYNAIGDAPLQQVYRDLGIAVPDVRGPQDAMSVREYAAFFRILYNASYLGREQSERALEYLAQTQFRTGLVAGVPVGVVVSHKFGERTTDGQRQLHDCGIVYEPEEPYILCVMTRGKDFADLAGTISTLSSLIYGEVHAQVARPR